MTWKRMLLVLALVMLAILLSVYFVISRQVIPGQAMTIMGASSIFPGGSLASVPDAKNNWQGFAFAGNFRFFSRSSPRAREDFEKLARENFAAAPLKTDLALFGGGIYVLQKVGKGYRMFCLFHKGAMNYWADMRSRDSLHFSRQAFERFILNLEIDGEKTAPRARAQVAALAGRIPFFFMQSPAQLLGMMAAVFVLTLLISALANRTSGSCPRRADLAEGACTPFATLRIGGFGRRKITACCLCREGEFLVIYRFRRPFLKIDIRGARPEITWGKSSFRYRHIRVILKYEDFQRWRSVLME